MEYQDSTKYIGKHRFTNYWVAVAKLKYLSDLALPVCDSSSHGYRHGVTPSWWNTRCVSQDLHRKSNFKQEFRPGGSLVQSRAAPIGMVGLSFAGLGCFAAALGSRMGWPRVLANSTSTYINNHPQNLPILHFCSPSSQLPQILVFITLFYPYSLSRIPKHHKRCLPPPVSSPAQMLAQISKSCRHFWLLPRGPTEDIQAAPGLDAIWLSLHHENQKMMIPTWLMFLHCLPSELKRKTVSSTSILTPCCHQLSHQSRGTRS